MTVSKRQTTHTEKTVLQYFSRTSGANASELLENFDFFLFNDRMTIHPILQSYVSYLLLVHTCEQLHVVSGPESINLTPKYVFVPGTACRSNHKDESELNTDSSSPNLIYKEYCTSWLFQIYSNLSLRLCLCIHVCKHIEKELP